MHGSSAGSYAREGLSFILGVENAALIHARFYLILPTTALKTHKHPYFFKTSGCARFHVELKSTCSRETHLHTCTCKPAIDEKSTWKKDLGVQEELGWQVRIDFI